MCFLQTVVVPDGIQLYVVTPCGEGIQLGRRIYYTYSQKNEVNLFESLTTSITLFVAAIMFQTPKLDGVEHEEQK
jgi:hypothetical protein